MARSAAPPPNPARASLRARLLLGAFALVLPLLVVEAALRIFWRPPPEFMATTFRGTGLLLPDEKLGWRMAPNFRLDFSWFWGDTSTIRTNSFGFRDVEHAREPTKGVPRVVVLGDSHAFGYGVDGDEMVTSVLRPLLPGVEILNLAETGYNIRQSRAMFEEEGAAFLPDIAVLAFCQNDVEQQIIPGIRSVTAKGNRDPWLIRHSYALRFLRDRVNTNRGLVRLCVSLGVKEELGGYDMLDPNLRPSLREYPPELAREWEKTCAELLLLRDSCAAAGARLLVVTIPSYQAVDASRLEECLTYLDYTPRDFDVEKSQRQLADLCARERIAFLDAYPAFVASQQDGAPPHFKHDMHINAQGHRILAELLAPLLRSMLRRGRTGGAPGAARPPRRRRPSA